VGVHLSISFLVERSNNQKDGIPFTGLTLPHYWSCPKPRSGFKLPFNKAKIIKYSFPECENF
jgi:hypothetical protein